MRDEDGFGAYYDIAITPLLKLTPDIHVIRPAHKQTISGGNIHTATVLGFWF